ncbi:MAG: hypothetical protein KDB16_19140, partial [Acidimicrobiales bacterium]|nr:hypothetical protein [Acidimicrobiales bacterium]
MAPDNARVAEIGRVLADIVKPARWPRTHPVEISANHIHGEPVPYEAAVAGTFEPFEEGDRWGPAWDTTWFEVRGRVPDDWAGQHVVLVVHLGFGGGAGFGAEGQVWVDGRPIHGISPNHREVELAAPAQGGERFELYIEAAANPPAIAADPGPMLAAEPWGEPLLELRRCHMATVDRDVVDLVRDWQLVADLAAHVKTQRASECAEALDRACAVIETDGVGPAAVRQARALLAEALSRGNDDTGRVKTHLAVGNSHLDTAWLWPLRETHRKAARTFSTAATMLDRNPDYRFAASQPQQLAWVRDEYPDLWNRLLDHVRSGRFEVMGAMW